LTVSAENVAVTAVKQHVSGKGTVIRFLETEGKDTAVNAELFGTKIAFEITHHAVKTLWVRDGEAVETDFVE
jgi:alpha-mannosidase